MATFQRERPTRRFSTARLQLQPLEDRRMLAFTASLAGTVATFTGDAAADTLTFSESGGQLRHNRFSAGDAGFASDGDFDSATAGIQPLAASAASTVSIGTGNGADIVNIGTAMSPASSLFAAFNFGTGGNSDTLTIDDGSRTAANTYSFGSTSLSATGINITVLTTVTGGKTLITGSGVDTVTVPSVATNEPIAITTTGGADAITVFGVNGVQNISSSVTISNPNSRSSVFVDNQGDLTARTANISETGVTGLSPANINITASQVSSLSVRGSAGADTFNVIPSTVSTLTFSIQGAGPNTFPGDSLNLDLTGATGAGLTATAARTGLFSFGNRSNVGYQGIERVTSGGTGTYVLTGVNTGSGNDTITLSASSGDLLVGVGGSAFHRGVLAEVAGGMTINGEAGNDTLNIDFSGGSPIPAGDLTFNGGSGGTDAMTLSGGTFNTIRHFFTNATDGRAEFDGDNVDNAGTAESRVNYTGLDPITDTMTATNRVFTFADGADTITLGDDDTAGNNRLRISTNNGTSETVDFTTPTATLVVNLDSGGIGADTITLGAFDSASSISTSITINGGSGTDTIINNITGPANFVPTITINGQNDNDEVRILATATGTTTNVDTNNGALDRVVIGGAFSSFNTGSGSIGNLLGVVNVNDSGGANEVYIDDSSVSAASTWTLNSLGATPVFGGGGLQLTKTGSAGVISFTRFSTVVLQLALGTGDDTININSTNGQGGASTTVFANPGNDTFNIDGDRLGGNNDFRGNDGADQFNLTITTNIGALNPDPIAGLTLQGNEATGGAALRDRVTITDNASSSRTLNYQYLSTAGDINIQRVASGTGLFGASNLALQVRSTETLIYNAASNNDIVSVTGSATDDVLTVGLLDSDTAAVVFRGGTPQLNDFVGDLLDSRPGVAGGGLGPDLFIQGLSSPAGITLAGGGAGTSGDRAVVYAASEAALVDVGNANDIFGFGAGVLLPGFGVGQAQDTISVADTAIIVNNNNAGALTSIALTASFVQADVTRPAITVLGGDEAASANGDSVTVTPSATLAIFVDGGNPSAVAGDSFELDLTGVTGTTLPTAGTLNFTNRANVEFANFESSTLGPVTLSLVGDPSAENGGTATVVATLGLVSSQPVTVNLLFTGTATNNTDYSASSTSITIPAGSLTGSITFNGLNDLTDELDETIIVDIDTVTNGIEVGTQQVTATITDDDPVPSVTLSVVGAPLAENGGATNVVATLSNPSYQDVTVTLALSGNATVGADYSASTLSIAIPAGQTTGSITLTSINDTFSEITENIVVDITNVTVGTENGTQQVTIPLIDDDRFVATGATLTINLTPSNDTLTLIRYSATDFQVRYQGESIDYLTTTFNNVVINALGGSDQITVYGATGLTESVTMSLGALSYSGGGFSVLASSAEIQRAFGNPGDSAQIGDSVNSDFFVGLPTYSAMYRFFGESYEFLHQAIGFGDVDVLTTLGGTDIGFLYDSPGNDTYTGGPNTGRITGTGFDVSIRDFDQVYAFASTGNDTATVNDTAGDDTFYGLPIYSVIVSAGSINEPIGFDSVTVSSTGGNDVAIFFDSAGDDTFNATPDSASLSGAGYSVVANGFSGVYAYASTGSDTALYDGGEGDDIFYGLAEYSAMQAIGQYINQAIGFDLSRANLQTGGGSDIALLYDSAGNDTLVAAGNQAELTYGNGIINRVNAFDAVYAFQSTGSDDETQTPPLDFALTLVGTWA